MRQCPALVPRAAGEKEENVRRPFQIAACLLASMGLASSTAADITPIGPFSGDFSDHFGSYPQGAHATLDIMGGFATITRLTEGGSIKIEFSSSLGGDLVTPRSPDRMMGQLSVLEWVFDQPVSRFGGWWENNSRFDDANVEFFNASGGSMGTLVATVPEAGQAWVWNGWQSDTGIKRILVTGNDTEFLSGFIWYEDVQAVAAVPEPGTVALLAPLALFLLKRRRGMTNIGTVQSTLIFAD